MDLIARVSPNRRVAVRAVACTIFFAIAKAGIAQTVPLPVSPSQYVCLAKAHIAMGIELTDQSKAMAEYILARRYFASAVQELPKQKGESSQRQYADVLLPEAWFLYETSEGKNKLAVVGLLHELSRRFPANATAHYMLGVTDLERSHLIAKGSNALYDDGVRHIQRALALNPKMSSAAFALAQVAAERQQVPSACRYFSLYLRNLNTFDPFVDLFDYDGIKLRVVMAAGYLKRNSREKAEIVNVPADTIAKLRERATAQCPLPNDASPQPLVSDSTIWGADFSIYDPYIPKPVVAPVDDRTPALFFKRLHVVDTDTVGPRDTAAEVCQTLSSASGRSAIAVFPQPALYSSTLASAGHPVTWDALRTVVSRSGGIFAFSEDDKCVSIVQGTSYLPPGNQSRRAFGRDTYWEPFWTGYDKLSDQQKAALVSRDGLTYPITLEGMPSDWAPLVSKVAPSVPATRPRQVKVVIDTILNTNFPTVQVPVTKGWWQWIDIYLRNRTVSMPSFVVLPDATSVEIFNKPVVLPDGKISEQQFVTELERLTKYSVRIDQNIIWPDLAISGSTVTPNDLLSALQACGSAKISFLSSEKVIYVSLPTELEDTVGPAGMSPDRYRTFVALLELSAASRGNDLGPLPYGVLNLPLSSVGKNWGTTLFSTYAPPSAYQEIGFDPKTVSDRSPQHAVAIDKWLGLYTGWPAVTIPSITFRIMYEEQGIVPGHPNDWLPVTSGDESCELSTIFEN